MTDVSLPVTVLLSAGAMLVGVAVAFTTTRGRVDSLQERLIKVEGRLEKSQHELAAFQLEAAQKFVTDEMLEKLERRLTEAINHLGDRLYSALEARGPGARPTRRKPAP